LRDRTRLRKALAGDRTGWAQRLHALLAHEGWPCSRGRLLTREGRRWVAALELDPHVRTQVDVILAVIAQLEEQLEVVESELRRFARADDRCRALETIFGVGPILACHLLAEIGDAPSLPASTATRPRQRARPDRDRVGRQQAPRPARQQGSRHLRWALVEAAQHAHRRSSPDHVLYSSTVKRCGRGRARLTVARKIGHRAFHVLNTAAV
jgi:transposase